MWELHKNEDGDGRHTWRPGPTTLGVLNYTEEWQGLRKRKTMQAVFRESV